MIITNLIFLISLCVLVLALRSFLHKTKEQLFVEQEVSVDDGEMAIYYVKFDEEIGWFVEFKGDVVACADTQEDAIRLGKEFASSHAENVVFIYEKDGTLKEEFYA